MEMSDEMGAENYWPWGVSVGDLNADGDLDIVTNEFGSVPMVLVSNLSDQREVRYLQIRLRGQASNRDGLGARVTVTAELREGPRRGVGVPVAQPAAALFRSG